MKTPSELFPVDLGPNYDQLSLILSKAITHNTPLPWNKATPIQLINFPALHHDLYKLAIEGPYGLLIRQAFDQIFLLVTMQQALLALALKISELEQLLKDIAADDEEHSPDKDAAIPYSPQAEKYQSQLDDYKEQYAQLSQQIIDTRQRMLLQNRLYMIVLSRFLTEIVPMMILSRALELKLDMNDEEKKALLKPVARAHIETKLTELYGEKGKSKDTDAKIDNQLASRLLHAEELKTLMVLHQYRLRKLEEVDKNPLNLTNDLKKTTAPETQNLDKAQTAQGKPDTVQFPPAFRQVQALRENSTSTQPQSNPESTNAQATTAAAKADPRARFAKSRDADSNSHSVMATMTLLKQFNGTFKTLDDKLKGLQALNKEDKDPEKLYEAMQRHVDKVREQARTSPAKSSDDYAETSSPSLK